MKDEIPEMNTYPLKEPGKPAIRKPCTSGVGVSIWLALWGLIFFMFEAYSGLSSWLMWTFRIAGLLCLLLGAFCAGMSLEQRKEE